MSKKIFKILGNNIKNIRLKNGYSIKKLSKKSGIRKKYLKKIEEGKAVGIKISHIFILAEALNVLPHEIVEGI